MKKRNKTKTETEDVNTLTINQDFAKKFEVEQSKLAFSKQDKKGARQSEFDKLRQELESEDEGDDEGDDEEEDEEGQLLTPQVDRAINMALAAIRKKDKQFLATATPVIVEQLQSKATKNNASVKSILAKQALNGDPSDEEEAVAQIPETTVAQQQRLKKEFLKEAKKADESDSDSEDLFTVKSKTPEELAKEAEETAEGKKALENFFKRDNLTNDDAFMKNYLSQEWWKEKDLAKLPSYKDITGEEPMEFPDTDEDEDVLDAQDNFESDYNFRFQEGGAAAAIMSYPRVVEDTVRQTTSKRKRQRESKAERENAEKLKREEELKRLKSLKRKEIDEKVKTLKSITGTASKAIDAKNLKLDRPFDPEEHDRMMREMFDNEYYEEADGDILDDEVRAKIVGADEEDFDIKPGKFLREDVQKVKRFADKKKKNKKKAAKLESETFGGDFGVAEADLDDQTRKEAEKVQAELQAKIKELENLDFEDVIAGDIKCHFHYREVQPKDFGMTTEEILNASDKELNQMVSMKKLAPFRPDANSNLPWWEMKGKRKTTAAKAMREKRRLEKQGVVAPAELISPQSKNCSSVPSLTSAIPVSVNSEVLNSQGIAKQTGDVVAKQPTVVKQASDAKPGKPQISNSKRRRDRQKKVKEVALQKILEFETN